MKKINNPKGLTLVSLILTVIIMLILAAIAISQIKEDGILGHANNQKEQFGNVSTKYNDLINGQIGLLKNELKPGENSGTSNIIIGNVSTDNTTNNLINNNTTPIPDPDQDPIYVNFNVPSAIINSDVLYWTREGSSTKYGFSSTYTTINLATGKIRLTNYSSKDIEIYTENVHELPHEIIEPNGQSGYYTASSTYDIECDDVNVEVSEDIYRLGGVYYKTARGTEKKFSSSTTSFVQGIALTIRNTTGYDLILWNTGDDSTTLTTLKNGKSTNITLSNDYRIWTDCAYIVNEEPSTANMNVDVYNDVTNTKIGTVTGANKILRIPLNTKIRLYNNSDKIVIFAGMQIPVHDSMGYTASRIGRYPIYFDDTNEDDNIIDGNTIWGNTIWGNTIDGNTTTGNSGNYCSAHTYTSGTRNYTSLEAGGHITEWPCKKCDYVYIIIESHRYSDTHIGPSTGNTCIYCGYERPAGIY